MDTYRIHHDWDRHDSITTSVVEGVAEVSGEDPREIEPLYEVVDPDALDRLVSSLRKEGSGSVAFVFGGLEVTVHADGLIEYRSTD